MRFGLLAIALAGCASAGQPAVGSDASGGGGGGGGPVFMDAPAQRPDAPPADAYVPPDAPAPPPDAYIPPDAACVPMNTELLTNPAFDLTPVGTGWTQTPIDPSYPPITSDGFMPQSAPYKAWMGGFAGSDIGASSATDEIHEDVAIPAGTTKLVLTGYYTVGTNENPNDAVYDTASVDLIQTNGTPIENALQLSNLTNTGATYAQFTYTFTSNLAGQTVRFRITSTNNANNLTNFFFDTLSLQATVCQ